MKKGTLLLFTIIVSVYCVCALNQYFYHNMHSTSKTLSPRIITEQYHYIFLDMDGTIGNFTSMSEDMGTLRPNIVGFLKRQRNQKTQIIITSAADFVHTFLNMKRIGLLKNIDDIFPSSKLLGCTLSFKDFAKTGERYGLSTRELSEFAISIGDTEMDVPQSDNMVGIIVDGACTTSANVIEEIINTLLKEGDGSFTKGFDVLYQKASKTTSSLTMPRCTKTKTIVISNRKIRITLGFFNNGKIITDISITGNYTTQTSDEEQTEICSLEKIVEFSMRLSLIARIFTRLQFSENPELVRTILSEYILCKDNPVKTNLLNRKYSLPENISPIIIQDYTSPIYPEIIIEYMLRQKKPPPKIIPVDFTIKDKTAKSA